MLATCHAKLYYIRIVNDAHIYVLKHKLLLVLLIFVLLIIL